MKFQCKKCKKSTEFIAFGICNKCLEKYSKYLDTPNSGAVVVKPAEAITCPYCNGKGYLVGMPDIPEEIIDPCKKAEAVQNGDKQAMKFTQWILDNDIQHELDGWGMWINNKYESKTNEELYLLFKNYISRFEA